mmetsp:Transcript_3065/g.5802  ORF Transcript_3065/g.5802 Transcript_3065/m.5802 type:complete len:263 (-) Transcript_3065:429-1217(-)
MPWSDEFEHVILGPINIGLGPFVEVAFNHKPSRSLIVTESILRVPKAPPAIAQVDPYPLLYHARSRYSEPLVDTPEERARGWAKTVLFAFYLRPVPVDLVKTIPTFQNWFKSEKFPAFEGFFPFEWPEDKWRASFGRLSGRLLVPPILENFILNRGPNKALDWADKVGSLKFNKIIPAHFEAPISANPREFRSAFEFLEDEYLAGSKSKVKSQFNSVLSAMTVVWARKDTRLPEEDMIYLRDIDNFFVQNNVSPPRGKLSRK